MIRLAMPDDLPGVQGLVHAAYTPYVERIGRPPAPMLDDYARRVTERTLWVLTAEDQPIGCVVVVFTHDGARLDNVAVTPTMQGRGYGSRLIAHAEPF